MADRPDACLDRPPVHPKRGPGRVLATRLKLPDAARLNDVLDDRGLIVADYLRGLIHRDLDATVRTDE